MKTKIVVFASGSGSNFENIVIKAKEGYIPAEVSCLISDKASAGAIKRAIKYGIKAIVINWREKELAEKKALIILEKEKPALIILAGFMRILSPIFISHWRWKILNIHPSLLPAFEGTTNAIELSIKKGLRISGCTIHFVDESIDGGPIIAQAAIPIAPNDEKIEEKIHYLEHKLYPMVIKGILEKKIIFDEIERKVIYKNVKIQDLEILSPEID